MLNVKCCLLILKPLPFIVILKVPKELDDDQRISFFGQFSPICIRQGRLKRIIFLDYADEDAAINAMKAIKKATRGRKMSIAVVRGIDAYVMIEFVHLYMGN